MDDLGPPSRTARLVVGLLALLALTMGALGIAMVAYFALLVGVPGWIVGLLVLGILGAFWAALERVRRAASRPASAGVVA